MHERSRDRLASTSRRLARWFPAILALVCIAVLLARFDVPVQVTLKYAGYLAVIGCSGTIAWRVLLSALGRPSRSFLEETAAGIALGIALQALLTWALTPLGLARWAAMWVVAAIACTAGVRDLRRWWRRQSTARTHPAVAWATATVSVLAVWWTANSTLRVNPLAPVPGMPGQVFSPRPYIDMMFHQGLAAASLHGGRGYPSVSDVPLRYTTMVYEHIGDAARWTGIDLTFLVMRLMSVAMIVLAVCLCAVLAQRLGGVVAGALGGALAFLTHPPAVFADVQFPAHQVGALNYGTWRSPTQDFGLAIFALLVIFLVVVLEERRVPRWAALPALPLAFIVGGAKAVFPPMLLCGLGGALVIGWLLRTRRSWTLVACGAAVAAGWLATFPLLVGTDARGLEVGDGSFLLSRLAISPALGDLTSPVHLGLASAVVVAMWALGVVAGFVPLFTRPRDLRMWILIGTGAGGVGATLLGEHPGGSQLYFLRGAWPILGVLAAVGIASLASRAGLGRHTRFVTLGATPGLVLGLAVAATVRRSFAVPEAFVGRSSYLSLAAPFLVVIGIAVLLGLLVAIAVPRLRNASVRRRTVTGTLVALLVVQGASLTSIATQGLLPSNATGGDGPWVPEDGAVVARWLREHSTASDGVATNMHCVRLDETRGCDARHFWLAALSERQVLVEGWAFSTPSRDIAPDFGTDPWTPFWDPEFLARNDAAITRPTVESTTWLRDQGIAWIVVNREVSVESPELAAFAALELERGNFAVYRLTSAVES